jgi:Flp pilus assembly protein TadB
MTQGVKRMYNIDRNIKDYFRIEYLKDKAEATQRQKEEEAKRKLREKKSKDKLHKLVKKQQAKRKPIIKPLTAMLIFIGVTLFEIIVAAIKS